LNNKLSIVIPVFHERESINPLIDHLHALGEGKDYEIIVVDGSPDGNTVKDVKDKNVIKIVSRQGRARQMNTGADAAKGEILLFLHADTKLPENAFMNIIEIMQDGTYVGGAFDLELETDRKSLRFIAWTARIRVRYTHIPYGDQAIFIRKDYFDSIGGYRDLPLMEDVELMERIKKLGGKIHIMRDSVQSSPRKWLQDGIFYTTLRNHMIRILYSLGVSPDKLARLYYKDLKPFKDFRR
jgi:rSAM/selenodomain-associated transferase 2